MRLGRTGWSSERTPCEMASMAWEKLASPGRNDLSTASRPARVIPIVRKELTSTDLAHTARYTEHLSGFNHRRHEQRGASLTKTGKVSRTRGSS